MLLLLTFNSGSDVAEQIIYQLTIDLQIIYTELTSLSSGFIARNNFRFHVNAQAVFTRNSKFEPTTDTPSVSKYVALCKYNKKLTKVSLTKDKIIIIGYTCKY